MVYHELIIILRLYFNQIDSVLRDTALADKSDAVGWFVG